MKKVVYVTELVYNGHDFCGELSVEEAMEIINSQPTELEFDYDENYEDEYSDMVEEWFCDNGYLDPSSYKYKIYEGDKLIDSKTIDKPW
jgi:hypothetical protein